MSKLDLLTVDEVAAELRVDPQTVRKLLKSGDLIGSKVGNRWRVAAADLQAFAQGERLSA